MSKRPNGNLWQASCAERIETAPLMSDRHVDLAIIGGGFTGSSAALFAAERGASVCLLEGATIGFGGSGRNVGLANAGLWLPPEDIIAALGPEAGNHLLDALAAAPDRVFGTIEKYAIACEPVRKGTLHLAHSAKGLGDLQTRHRQGIARGYPVALLSEEETSARTGASGFHGALFDPRAGTIQPLAYCIGLARAAQSLGAEIFEQTPVFSYRHDGASWRIETKEATVYAKALLLATNAYHDWMGDESKPPLAHVHYSQYATAPLSAAQRETVLAGGEGCWDTATVMSSFRLDAAGRLIFGGMCDRESAVGGVHDTWAQKSLARLFPDLGPVSFDHAWQGRIAMSKDYIPKILELGPKGLCCIGYSGRGIGPGTVFGAECARALLGNDQSGLPLAPITGYEDRFASAKSLYYETGATLAHAIAPSPLSR